MEEFYKAIEGVIECIVNSFEYQECIKIKKKMEENQELMNIIEKIKKLQKKYVQSNYSGSVKKELDELKEKLSTIPIYVIYLQKLAIINEKIDYVKDSLNDYFNCLMN